MCGLPPRACTGWASTDAPLISLRKNQVGEWISMLDQTVSDISQVGIIEAPDGPHDRSMDVLQYATAFVAVLVAVLLAVIH